MVSERKNIRNNLPQPVRPMHMSDRVEDIWHQMMKHFETHSRFIVQFVKYIPENVSSTRDNDESFGVKLSNSETEFNNTR
ncbi:unnamed protein product [Trichobilharzia regenti]|nr:unnamed protein product [Trichobilharzia regenti]